MFKNLKKNIAIAFWSFVETIYLEHIGVCDDVVFPEENDFEPSPVEKILDGFERAVKDFQVSIVANEIKDREAVNSFLSRIGMN